MNKEVFDSVHGVRTTAIFDDEGVTFKYEQDVAPILDVFKEQSAQGHNPNAIGRLAASVPIHLHTQWVKEWEDKHKPSGVIELKPFLAMKINSPEYAYLRNQKIRG